MKNIEHITTEKNLLDAGATLTDTHKGTIKIYKCLTHQYIVKDGKVVQVFEPYKKYVTNSYTPPKKKSNWDEK